MDFFVVVIFNKSPEAVAWVRLRSVYRSCWSSSTLSGVFRLLHTWTNHWNSVRVSKTLSEPTLAGLHACRGSVAALVLQHRRPIFSPLLRLAHSRLKLIRAGAEALTEVWLGVISGEKIEWHPAVDEMICPALPQASAQTGQLCSSALLPCPDLPSERALKSLHSH